MFNKDLYYTYNSRIMDNLINISTITITILFIVTLFMKLTFDYPVKLAGIIFISFWVVFIIFAVKRGNYNRCRFSSVYIDNNIMTYEYLKERTFNVGYREVVLYYRVLSCTNIIDTGKAYIIEGNIEVNKVTNLAITSNSKTSKTNSITIPKYYDGLDECIRYIRNTKISNF